MTARGRCGLGGFAAIVAVFATGMLFADRGWGQGLVPVSSLSIGTPTPGRQVPVWSDGFLFSIEGNGNASTIIHRYNREGVAEAPVVFGIPDADHTAVFGIGVTPDGGIVVCGKAITADGKRGSFLSWIAPGGSQAIQTLRTDPYLIYGCAVGPDGTVWTRGSEREATLRKAPAGDLSHGMIRTYSAPGKPGATFIPENSLAEPRTGSHEGQVAFGGGRFGFYSSAAQKYFEVGPDGAITAFPAIALGGDASSVTNLAIAADGSVLANTTVMYKEQGKADVNAVYLLDRQAQAWKPVTLPASGGTPVLFGADGGSFVFRGSTWTDVAFYQVK